MDTIYIKKIANGYTVELSTNYMSDRDDELYLYKTREEMEADLPNLITRAHELGEAEKAKKAEKEAK